MHKLSGQVDPTVSFRVGKAIQSVWRQLPKSEEILHIIAHKINLLSSEHQRSLYQSMFLLAFHAFLRVGEIIKSEYTLQLSDVVLRSTEITVQFRTAKNSNGLSQVAVVSTLKNSLPCPVAALKRYVTQRGPQQGPLFCSNGKAIARQQFVHVLKSVSHLAGIPSEHFNSHSFQIGAATSCAQKGASDAQIRQLGRWNYDAFK